MANRTTFNLTAAADTLAVDVAAGERYAVTTLKYSKEPDWVLLHRLDADDWMRVPIPLTGPTDPALSQGNIMSLPVEPGHCYQACIVPVDFRPDPQHQPYDWTVSFGESEGPPAFVSVVALRKRPEESDFYSDGNVRTYGTYHERDVATKQPVFAQLSIGTSRPTASGDGRLLLPSPTAVHVRGPGQTFAFQIPGLLPGTEYYTVLLLVDEFGNWQFLEEHVTTLQRKVQVELQGLFIIDDGDLFSEGEGSFDFWVHTAGGPYSSQLHYDNKDLDSGHFVQPPPTGTVVLGPYTPAPDKPLVFFEVHSWQDNKGAPLENNDLAMGEREIPCPSGPGETVNDVPSAVQVAEYGGGSYEFRVDYRYSVSYI